MTLRVYIGWDSREDLAYQVCRYSILNRASVPVRIVPLKHRELRQQALFWRPWLTEGGGQMIDCIDGRPMSTEFAFTRFLVPHLALQDGADWALFCDCDFLFRADVKALFDLAQGSGYAAMCVKHAHEPRDGEKMDGCQQTVYRRKNWSSLMLLNVKHPAVAALTPELVSQRSGAWLHGLQWLPDEAIGALPESWNHLVGHSPGNDPKAVHFTNGGPWMTGYENVPFADEWRHEHAFLQNPRPSLRIAAE